MESFGVLRATPLVSSRRAVHVHVHASTRKVRMCTGKVCSKQGSKQVRVYCYVSASPIHSLHVQAAYRTCFLLPDSSGERCSMVHQVLKFAQDLGLEELDVKECGCLGAPSRNLRYDSKQSHTA